ncbi:hypothetical protein RND81_04G062900 [Saponaria officinalis]|uniref:Uncharacterized protein n=1 Tax=Saponaria officinalis TaxID=3572 RepID=A0AAW1LIE6_SAPOF
MTGNNGLAKFRRCIVKLKRCMKFMQQVRPIMSDDDELESIGLTGRAVMVPKGHFAVLAGNGDEEKKRFVVELRHLKNPALVKLLKVAEEEYGFQQEGALVVPCTPAELQKILEDDVYNNN